MSRFSTLIAGAAALVLASTVSVSAQTVSGTIDVTGSVGEKCWVHPGNDEEFDDLFALGELSEADGTLLTSLENSADGSAADSSQFRVHCNTAAPTISLEADPLENSDAAPTGYANTVNYVAELEVNLAGGSSEEFTYDAGSGDPATTDTLGGAIANAANNVTVSMYDLSTAAVTDLLVAGDYVGQIRVTIAPGI